MANIFRYLSASILLFGLISCEPKINLNDDYKAIPIVFGLLDQSDSIHYIKITKAFLGNGNNYDFAKVDDSSYFKQVDAKVIELFNGEITGREWNLEDIIIEGKKEGVFYSPDQKVYVFHEKNLLEDHSYKLEAIIPEIAEPIYATTELINGFDYELYGMTKMNLAKNNNGEDNDYRQLRIRYKEALHGQRYHTGFNITIRETYENGESKIIDLRWSAPLYNGFKDADVDPEHPNNKTVSFSGEGFYIYLDEELSSENDDLVAKRELIRSVLTTEIAHFNLVRFMDISAPSTSIAQSTPLFTNINGGLGLFSSRHIAKPSSPLEFLLDDTSMEELCIGTITGHLKFCSSSPSQSGESYYCQ